MQRGFFFFYSDETSLIVFMFYLSKRNSLAEACLVRNFITVEGSEGQWRLIGIDRNLGGRTTELFITFVQLSKEQSEAVLSVSYHIRSNWKTNLHLKNDLQWQAWQWVAIITLIGLHFQAIVLQKVKCKGGKGKSKDWGWVIGQNLRFYLPCQQLRAMTKKNTI